MDQGKYTINIHENISFVVNIKQQIVFFSLLLFLQRFGVIFLVLVSIGFAIGMLYHYVKVLNLKENQKDTVCIESELHYMKTALYLEKSALSNSVKF